MPLVVMLGILLLGVAFFIVMNAVMLNVVVPSPSGWLTHRNLLLNRVYSLPCLLH
jgi:hypothetical protein